MNGILFFIPFLAILGIGLYSDAFAVETVTGETSTIIRHPDGSHTFTTHFQYIFDGNRYVPYIQDGLNVRSVIGDVTLSPDGSYVWNDAFTDNIQVKFATDRNPDKWTYPNRLNNDVPDVSFIDGQFHAIRHVDGVGEVDYRYIFNDGKWKTELVATNLSARSDIVFGFDQIIDLNTDEIAFGVSDKLNGSIPEKARGSVPEKIHDKIKRNLDDYDGHTFDRDWIKANESKVLNFLNNVEFDFDLGFENLNSITVYDTGVDSSRLVFDYRTDTILLPGETLLIDPTFSYTTSTDEFYVGAKGQTGTSCGDAYSIYDDESSGEMFLRSSSQATDFSCHVGAYVWDTSSIPSNAVITDVSIRYDVDAETNARNCTITGIDNADPRTYQVDNAVVDNTDADLLWDDIMAATEYVSNSSDCTAVATNYVQDLGASADADMQSRIADGWFGIGWHFHDMTRTSVFINVDTDNMELQVTYTLITVDAVDDLTYANLDSSSLDLIWTEPELNGGNLTNYMVNSTTPWSSTTSFLANTTDTYYNVTGLGWGTPYSFSVAALTENGYNFTGNILNVTTDAIIYTGVAPTDFAVNDCYHTCDTQLNLEWAAALMDNINGFRIYFETPVGNGFTLLTGNTTNTTTYYNHTSLTAGQFYNYKVAAMNGSGISENSTAYVYSPHKLPDAVDDLAVTTNEFLQFLLTWTAPDLYGTISGYNINYTTPAGDPVTVYVEDTGTSATSATVSGLDPTTEHTFRISAVTIHGKNVTGANLPNATNTVEIEIGDLEFEVETNPDAQPIWFELFNVDNTTDNVQVRFDSALTVDCTVSHRIAGTNTTYTGLSETAGVGYVYHNFTVTNAGNDILDWDCQDQTDPTSNGQYSLTQVLSSSGTGGAANVPMFSQINNFSDGLYGTEGDLGGIDLITLFIVIVSMLGFNRTHPALGVGVMTTLLGAAWYFELIPWTSAVLGGIALVVVLSIGMGLKKRD